MNKVNDLLTQRLKKSDNTSKMSAMAKQSVNGHLTSFSGVFSISELSQTEKEKIEHILNEYADENIENVSHDLASLISITSEVKAINNQAALLHGERIKKAQTILTRYRDGAFTAWLLAAYGNRQTPYNLLQYFEFCEAMPKTLRLQIEAMPRQAIYTLASREGPFEKKRHIVETYNGQTKAELLTLIRELFPLDDRDGRRQDLGESCVQLARKLFYDLKKKPKILSKQQKEDLIELLAEINTLLN